MAKSDVNGRSYLQGVSTHLGSDLDRTQRLSTDTDQEKPTYHSTYSCEGCFTYQKLQDESFLYVIVAVNGWRQALG